MSETSPTPAPVAANDARAPARAPVTPAEWLAGLEAAADETGYVQSLGPRHWAFFHDDSPTLLVTFERAGAIRGYSADRLPDGFRLAREKGWSHLCLIAEGDTWYRDPAVYRYFDRLIDDAFFEDFERVLFYGAQMCGYAACAYSVAAPGATVLAVQPVATLDPAVAGWDGRYARSRRLNFTDRFGFAPEMTEGAGQVFVVHDPAEREDAMHAALFHRPWVTQLRARRLGSSLEAALRKMALHDTLLTEAAEGRLTPLSFAQAFRTRRTYGPYLRRVLAIQAEAGRTARELMICRSVVGRVKAPTFRKRLGELMGEGKG
ncbi:MAG: phosphoadenosine phosphosulfate reductase [Gemmobacter sp.]